MSKEDNSFSNLKTNFSFLDDLDDYILKSNQDAEERVKETKIKKKIIEKITEENAISKHNENLYYLLNNKQKEKEEVDFIDNRRLQFKDSNRSKFFSKDISNAKSLEEAYEELEISKESIDKINLSEFEILRNKVIDEEISLLAYLNTEFNLLNKKMYKCLGLCYKSNEVLFKQAKLCESNCRVGCNNAYNFVDDIYKDMKNTITTCLNDQKMDVEKMVFSKYNECYSDLIKNFKESRINIQEELSNYI